MTASYRDNDNEEGAAEAGWSAWLQPVMIGALIVLGALYGKAYLEADAELERAEALEETYGAVAALPELTFSAQQITPLVPPSERAAERIADRARDEQTRGAAQSALVAASAGSRSVLRPYEQLLVRIYADDQVTWASERFGSPSVGFGLLAAVAFWAWIGSGLWWIWRGHRADGEPMDRRRWAALSTVGWLIVWWASVAMI